jgi:hypothetical protein
MAHLTQEEFGRAIGFLAEDLGLQRLRDRFVRLNALVTRRRVASAQSLADQLYLLTAGLRRQVPATVAFHTIWTKQVSDKVGEEGEKALEELAERINQCLGEHDRILDGKEADLEQCLREYEQRLAGAIGSERARVDMLLKAVPAVSTKLRSMGTATPAEKQEDATAVVKQQTDAETR